MTTREELRRIVDILSEENAVELLEYATEEQIRRGNSVSWKELRRQLDI